MATFHDIPPEVVIYILEFSVLDGRPFIRELTDLDKRNTLLSDGDEITDSSRHNTFTQAFTAVAAQQALGRTPYDVNWNRRQVAAASRAFFGRFGHVSSETHLIFRNLDLSGIWSFDKHRVVFESYMPDADVQHRISDTVLKFIRFSHLLRLDLGGAALSAKGLHKLCFYNPSLIELRADLRDSAVNSVLAHEFSFAFLPRITASATSSSDANPAEEEEIDDEFKDVHPILRKKLQQKKRQEQQRGRGRGRGRAGASVASSSSPAARPTMQQRLDRALAKQQNATKRSYTRKDNRLLLEKLSLEIDDGRHKAWEDEDEIDMEPEGDRKKRKELARKALISLVQQCPSLKQLKIGEKWEVTMDETVLESIANSCPQLRLLDSSQKLRVPNDDLVGGGFASWDTKLKHLVSLNIVNGTISKQAVDTLIQHPSLQEMLLPALADDIGSDTIEKLFSRKLTVALRFTLVRGVDLADIFGAMSKHENNLHALMIIFQENVSTVKQDYWKALLEKSPSLENLSVQGAVIDFESAAVLANAQQLRRVALIRAAITDVVARKILTSKHIENLNLRDNLEISSATFSSPEFLNNRRLRAIDVQCTNVDATGLVSLYCFPGLHTLRAALHNFDASQMANFVTHMKSAPESTLVNLQLGNANYQYYRPNGVRASMFAGAKNLQKLTLVLGHETHNTVMELVDSQVLPALTSVTLHSYFFKNITPADLLALERAGRSIQECGSTDFLYDFMM